MVLCININELNWILELMTCRVQNEALLDLQRRKDATEKKEIEENYVWWFLVICKSRTM